MAISLGEYSIALDSKDDEANVNFVSHAHTDHMSGLRKNKTALASTITKDLVEARSNLSMELIEEPDCVELLNAGHMLGSRQLFIQNDLYGYSMLYSGDYQMDEPVLAEKLETKQADVLIVDSTYPYPEVRFDDKSEVIDAIQFYTRKKTERGHVVFSAYTVGRAQELVKILNAAGMIPAVDEKIAAVNEVYKKHGVPLEYVPIEQPENSPIIITGQSRIEAIRDEIRAKSIKRVYTAVASGWSKIFRFNTDVQFNLSDHADFHQALEYINACSPKIVFTFGSSAKPFAKQLAVRGYDARPLVYTSQVNALMLNHI